MGFNISGIAINKNYKDKLPEPARSIDLSLAFDSEITYEEAAGNWKEDGICDIYFSDKGTLLFLPMDNCTDGYAVKGQTVLTFALSETSMAFNLNYYKNDRFVREAMEFDGDRVTDEGDPLPQENEEINVSGLAFQLIQEILGQKIEEIDLEARAYRYAF